MFLVNGVQNISPYNIVLTDPYDYRGILEQLTFSPTDSQYDVYIPITGDTQYEINPEKFVARLALETPNVRIQLSPDNANVWITDDDSKRNNQYACIFATVFAYTE